MDIVLDKHYNLRRLKYWLNRQFLSFLLLFIAEFHPSLAILIFIAGAVIFTPFMLKVLIEEKRYGWILFFILLVVFPLIILLLIDPEMLEAYMLIPLAFFYLYCFLLRITVDDWMEGSIYRKI